MRTNIRKCKAIFDINRRNEMNKNNKIEKFDKYFLFA